MLFKKKQKKNKTNLGLNFRGKKKKTFMSLVQRSKSKNKFLLKCKCNVTEFREALKEGPEITIIRTMTNS